MTISERRHDQPNALEAVMGLDIAAHETVIRVQGAKPRLRGIPDVVALFVILPAVTYLIREAQPGVATIAAIVYSTGLVALFAVSAAYHVPTWPMAQRERMRRLDHSIIYVLIAATYTPVCLVVLPPQLGQWVLVAVWTLAALGAVKTNFWVDSPRWLNTASYVVMGWLITPFLGDVWQGMALSHAGLIIVGGLLYTFGALIYAKRWFNLRPGWFGYHEVFHVLVIAAAACHFAAMWQVLVAT